MTQDKPTKMPLPEGWEARVAAEGKEHFLIQNNFSTAWADPRNRLSPVTTFTEQDEGELPFGWKEVWDPKFGVYYIDHNLEENQSDHPRLQWRSEQEVIVKEYLNMAFNDLMQKKEMCGLKQERLRIAKEELSVKLETLNKVRLSSNDVNSALAISNGGGITGGGQKVVKHDPEVLKAEVKVVRQRVKKLALELLRMKSRVTMSEKGIDALSMVNKKISDPEKSRINMEEAGEMMRGIRGMNMSIRMGEQRKRELLKSVADLSTHFSSCNLRYQSNNALSPAFSCADTASQTDVSGDPSNHYGTIAKLRLTYDQNKRIIADILRRLIEIEKELSPHATQFDASRFDSRLLLIDEKNKLLQELRSRQSPEWEERIIILQDDVMEMKDAFQEDLKKENERLLLTKRRVELEEELLLRTRDNARIEMQIKGLCHSMTSISSGSSIGSMGSLSASSRGSQNSVAPYDLYSMQDLNRSQQQIDLPDFHHKVESIFQDQNPFQSGLSNMVTYQQNFPHSLSYQSGYPMIADDYNDHPDEMTLMVPSFQPYPTVEEEIEDGDEGFGIGEEENEGSEGLAVARPPPSYEDHLQIATNQTTQKYPCLYQQRQQQVLHYQEFQDVNQCDNQFCSQFNEQNYFLVQQQQQLQNMLQQQNVQQLQFQHQQQQACYDGCLQQCWQGSDPMKYFQTSQQIPNKVDYNHSSDALNPPIMPCMSSNCTNRHYKFFSNMAYPTNLLSSNSLPSLFNVSSVTPMTNSGSESQIFKSKQIEINGDGYSFHPVQFISNYENDGDPNGELADLLNSQLAVERLPNMDSSLPNQFLIDNNNTALQQQQQQQEQFYDNQLPLKKQHQPLQRNHSNNINYSNYSNNNNNNNNNNTACLKFSPLPKNACLSTPLELSVIITSANRVASATGQETFATKSSSTSLLHSLTDTVLTTTYSPVVSNSTLSSNSFHKNNTSTLSLSSSSLGEDSSNLGSDSGVYESTNRLNHVLSAQIRMQFTYDYAKQELLVCIEKARNLSALSVHNINEILFKVSIIPFTSNCHPHVEEKGPCCRSNIGKFFHFPVESDKVLSKTIQVFALRFKDVNQLHQQPYSQEESLGMSLISLASFNLNSSISNWYNILSFQIMDMETNRCVQTPASSSKNESTTDLTSTSSVQSVAKTTVELKNFTACPPREESSDESTVISSQTSTLTRCGEPEEINKGKPAKNVTAARYNNDKFYQVPVQNVSSAKCSNMHMHSFTCDKETNTDKENSDAQKTPCNQFCPRKPIAPGSKFNRETAIRRWRTFSPAAAATPEEDHSHKLNRSGSDSSVRRRKSHFDRQALHRQSIRLKKHPLSVIKPMGAVEAPKNQTSIDLMVDYHAYKTKLDILNKEINALQTIKIQLEEAKEKGETELSWLLGNEDLQALLMETSGTFRKKAHDGRRLSDITDLTERKMRKVRMEMLSLQARNSCSNGEVDRLMFRKKMAFFTSQDENLSFLDQAETETEIDDPIPREVKDSDVEAESAPCPDKKAEPKTGLLSIKPSSPSAGDDSNEIENMMF